MATSNTVFNQKTAQAALVESCTSIGVDPSDAELLRLGENAVFRLSTRPAIARISRNGDRLPEAERLISVARWLAANDIPSVKILDIPQPIIAGGCVVSFWELATDREEYGSTTELAGLLRKLHNVDECSELNLPPLDPFERSWSRISTAAALSETDRTFLKHRHAELHAAYDQLEFELKPAVLHGDANVGNVIRDWHGRAILADLDGFAVGPREWDLILTAIYYDRFGWHTRAEYSDFVETYGYDLMKSSVYPTLADIREFLMVSWLAQNASDENSPERPELAKRILALRTGASRRDWKPF